MFVVSDENNIDSDWLLKDVPYDRAHISKRTNFIDWSSFVLIANRLADSFTAKEIFELSEASYSYPDYKVWLLIGRLRFDLFDFYMYIFGEHGAATKLYPLEIKVLTSTPALGRFTVCLSVPDHLEPCEPILRVLEGQAVGMSRALGYDPATVNATYGPRQVKLEITLPKETGLIPRLRRAIKFPFTWWQNLKVLYETQEALLGLQNELLDESRRLKAERQRSVLIQEQLDLVLNNQPVMLWTMDIELQLTYMSASVESFTGYSLEEAYKLSALSMITKESQDHAVAILLEFLEREKSSQPFLGTTSLRLLQVRKDGSTFWSENYVSFLRRDGDKAIGIIGFSVDITAVIAREAREESLEQQVQSLRQREFISQVAGGIAHDFNNSLQSIVGFAELGLTKLEASNASNELVKLQHHILNSAAGAAELTKKLLSLSSQQSLNRKSTNIATWLHDCLPMANSVLGKSIELNIHATETALVLIDVLEMERALLNLIINAKDAMGESGSITIMSQLHDTATLKGVLPPNKSSLPSQYVEISVADTGPGIPEADLNRIFEPFFTSKSSDKGMGLGLAITAGVVEQHDGFVRATNLSSGGAVMHIYMPQHEGSQRPDHASSNTISQRDMEVLLVDDEDTVRELCRTFLEAEGAIITEASSGHEAVNLVRARGFDLVVMDVKMSGLTGSEAAQIIRRFRPEQKFLFITGFAGSQSVLEELANDRVLPKPFRRAEFLSAVSALLSDQPTD
jgi:PAS domain S-box-containing protein